MTVYCIPLSTATLIAPLCIFFIAYREMCCTPSIKRKDRMVMALWHHTLVLCQWPSLITTSQASEWTSALLQANTGLLVRVKHTLYKISNVCEPLPTINNSGQFGTQEFSPGVLLSTLHNVTVKTDDIKQEKRAYCRTKFARVVLVLYALQDRKDFSIYW